MRIPWFSHASFILLLAAIGLISVASEEQDKTVSNYRDRSKVYDFSKKELKCLWRCEVDESDLSTRLNAAFTEGNKVISLRFTISYPKKVHEQCVNQTLNESIRGNATQWNYSSWELHLIDRKLPSSVNNAIQRFSSWIEAYARVYVNVSCNFTANSLINQELSGELSSYVYLERIIRSIAASLGELCNTEVQQNGEQTCIKISKDNASHNWTILSALGCFLFVSLFSYIGPTVVCLFVATEDTHEGYRQITIDGPSPVGFRSLIGNYFYSSDSTMWHMARKFIMHVVIMPLPFLVPAIFIEYLLYKNVLSTQTSIKERTHLFRPLKMVCYACYCIQAFYFYFFITGKNNSTRSCVREFQPHSQGPLSFLREPLGTRLREFHRDDINASVFRYCFHQELPQRMLARVHLVKGFSLGLWNYVLPSFTDETTKISLSVWSSCLSSMSFIRAFLILILMLALQQVELFVVVFPHTMTVCLWYILGLVILSPFAIICPFASSSLEQLMDVNFLPSYILFPARLVVVFLDILVCCLAMFGVVFVLQYAAVGVVIFLQLAIPLVFSEHNLPEDAFCVLVACYLWRSYRSFTQKYQDLAVALFEKQQQLKNKGRKTSFNMQNFPSIFGSTIYNVQKIPKALFNMACEELMPIRKSVRKLFLEATLSVFLVFLGFSLVTILTLPPAIKALFIFAVGLVPIIIVTIFPDWRRRNFEAEQFDKNVLEIAKTFFNSAPYVVIRDQKIVSLADSCSEDHMTQTILVNICFTALVVIMLAL